MRPWGVRGFGVVLTFVVVFDGMVDSDNGINLVQCVCIRLSGLFDRVMDTVDLYMRLLIEFPRYPSTLASQFR